MLKRYFQSTENPHDSQPPSGGCVLKRQFADGALIGGSQPPSGGCVLKPINDEGEIDIKDTQPPSGGCVLKPRRCVRLFLL